MTTTLVQDQPPSAQACGSSRPATPHESGWHFPGPSSRYHTRERSKAHLRSKSSISSPSIAPNLLTEQRAHRRARSSYATPLAHELERSTAAQRLFNAHSRRSPHLTNRLSPAQQLSRSPLSRFPSFDSSHVSSTMADEHELPLLLSTPAKSPSSRQLSILQDSPFSDYFTDDGRSIDGVVQPQAETHQLLVRLNKLQSALMRGGSDSQALHIIGRRMNEIENDMDALHSQSRQPPELDDSGLFLEEADDERCDSAREDERDIKTMNQIKAHQAPETDTSSPSQDSLSARDKILLEQAHDVLVSITQAQQNLQQRFNEMQVLRAQHSRDIEDKDATISKLRNQVSHLSTDREIDHSELLLYRSHIVHFVNQAKVMRGPAALDFVQGLRSVTRDWQETLNDMDRRRRRVEAMATDDPFYVAAPREDGRWSLNVTHDEDGNTDSVTIRRTKPSGPREKSDSKLFCYIDSVEQLIQDASPQSQCQYVDAATQDEGQHQYVDAATQPEMQQRYVDAGTQNETQHNYVEAATQYEANLQHSNSIVPTGTQCSYVNASTQTEGLKQHSLFPPGFESINSRLARMSVESRDADTCSQDDSYDDDDGDDDDSLYYRRRPVLSPPDDEDVHSCAITTTPASEADPHEESERGASRFMDIMSDFLDDPSEDEDQGGYARDQFFDHTLSADEDPHSGRSAWDELWDSLAEYAGVGSH